MSRLPDQSSAARAAQPGVLARSSEAELPRSSLMLEGPLACGLLSTELPSTHLLSLPGKEGAPPLQASSVSGPDEATGRSAPSPAGHQCDLT